MRKITLFLMAFMALTLVACKTKETHQAQITIKTINPARNSVYVELDVSDQEEEITKNSITGRLFQNDQELPSSTASPIKEDETDNIIGYKIEFMNLKVDVEYKLEVYATINKRRVVFQTQTFTTSKSGADENHPKYITNADEFIAIPQDPHAYYKLKNDIDFTGKENIRLFQASNFPGILDGDGFKLHNLTINQRQSYTALFGRISGTIKNITIDNMDITLSGVNQHSQYISFVVGRNSGTLHNVKVTNSSINTHFNYTGKIYVGGLSAYGDTNSKIEQSEVSATTFNINQGENPPTTQTEFHIGGLVGYLNLSKLMESKSDVVMNIRNSYKGYFGGAVGMATTSSQANTEIAKTIAMATINIQTIVSSIRTDNTTKEPETIIVAVGGFAGKLLSSKVSESIAEATINLKGMRNLATNNRPTDLYAVGGFVGLVYDKATLNEIYHNTTITSDIAADLLEDMFDFVYLGGVVGSSTPFTMKKASGHFNVNVGTLGNLVHINPISGELVEGDFFSSSIIYDATTYNNQELIVGEAINTKVLTPIGMDDYYTSTFIQEFLLK